MLRRKKIEMLVNGLNTEYQQVKQLTTILTCIGYRFDVGWGVGFAVGSGVAVICYHVEDYVSIYSSTELVLIDSSIN